MNLVDLIKDQLTSQATSKLASLIGGSEEKTQSAVGAAVPALLSAFTGISKGGGKGAEQLVTALSGFDTGTPGKLMDMFMKSPDKVQQEGSGLLGSLLSGGITAGLANTLSKYLGIDAGIIRKLLGYLTPMVMGVIANQFKGKAITAQGVSNLLADQQDNISQALPAGLDLSGIMGLANAAKDSQRVATPAPRATQSNESSFVTPLLTIAALVILGWLAWLMFSKKPEVATAPPKEASATKEQKLAKPIIEESSEAMQMPTNLRDTYEAATKAINSIKDVDSAKAALPKLQELNGKLNGLVALWGHLPEAAQAKVAEVTRNNLGDLKKIIEPVLAIPGVQDVLGPIIKEVVTKLQELGSAA